ncbi:Imm52 family immunity protein [Pectobacterium brasiliense]|uniref:Imm52 family immunity protein n=1 Tax=Pectobacterium brasiliense TaxID=180957 RepID=UPI00227D6152|nr:Imm52 family immunity protein [Pectobacterium brasiliense]WGL28087.1 Imm52 family immunity protein [Pectobacterium brasiliense]
MEIKFHVYMKISDANIENLLSVFLQFSNLDSTYRGETVDWFLSGKTKKSAMNKCIVHKGLLTENALFLMKKDLKNHPLVAKTLWSENGNQIIARNYLCSSIDNFWFKFLLVKENANNAKKIMSMLTEMINKIGPHIITLETNDYSLENRKVFPDRIPVGWLMYIDSVYGEGAFDLGDRAIDVKKSGESIGTLFLSKKGLFDGENEQDIQAANDLEILLAAHDVLPLYKDIF